MTHLAIKSSTVFFLQILPFRNIQSFARKEGHTDSDFCNPTGPCTENLLDLCSSHRSRKSELQSAHLRETFESLFTGLVI